MTGMRRKLYFHKTSSDYSDKKNSKIPKGQTEIVKSEDRQDHIQQNETKDQYAQHYTEN